MKQQPETKLVYIEQNGQRAAGIYRSGRFEVPAEWTEEKLRGMAHKLLNEAAIDWRIDVEIEPSDVNSLTIEEEEPLDPEDDSGVYFVTMNGDEIDIY